MRTLVLLLTMCMVITSLYAQTTQYVGSSKEASAHTTMTQGVSTASIQNTLIDFKNLDELLSKKDLITEISIQSKGLTKVPEALSKFSNLETIDLSHNKIGQIPLDYFKKFKKLKKVYLNNNLLTTGDLDRLQALYPSIKFYYSPSDFQ